MNFTEIIFFPFIVTVFSLFALFSKAQKLQIYLLLVASYIFYAWWRIDYLALIVLSSAVDYVCGSAIYKSRRNRNRKIFLFISLAVNLGLLGYFKYYNWFIGEVSSLVGQFGIDPLPVANIILPVGISFYTFQSMSYTIDIYRKEMKPCTSVSHFLLFVAAFPQLVAGPIVRAKEFIPQLKFNLAERCDFSGLWLVVYGLGKKVLVADQIGRIIVDPVYGNVQNYSSFDLMMATYGFAFQIFLDFSAYSDIALGLGRIFGLTLPVNFRAPYFATNPREFWRRWHISLSTWFRDYLYIPLGGSRKGFVRTTVNLMVTTLIVGLWHGAGGNFIVWGGLHGFYHGVFRVYDRFSEKKPLRWVKKVPKFIMVFIFFQPVCVAWVFFRSSDLDESMVFFQRFLSAGWDGSRISLIGFVVLLAGVLLHYFVEPRLYDWVERLGRRGAVLCGLAYIVVFIAVYALVEAHISSQSFIYFQF